MMETLPDTSALAPPRSVPESPAWDDVKAWRRALRDELIARRRRIGAIERARLRDAVAEGVRALLPDGEPRGHVVGFYWPIRGELDLRNLMAEFIEAGARAALPVVVEKNAPVEFWAWRPDMRMAKGFWDIPQPPERSVLKPTIVIVPLIGFDAQCYRLGYGGGYYDRTLAAADPRPYRIGVGLELGRLDSIWPQPHDIPMNAVATETTAFTP